MMWLILLLILADEDPSLSSSVDVVDPADGPCGRRSFLGPLPSMWLILLLILTDEDPSFDPLTSLYLILLLILCRRRPFLDPLPWMWLILLLFLSRRPTESPLSTACDPNL